MPKNQRIIRRRGASKGKSAFAINTRSIFIFFCLLLISLFIALCHSHYTLLRTNNNSNSNNEILNSESSKKSMNDNQIIIKKSAPEKEMKPVEESKKVQKKESGNNPDCYSTIVSIPRPPWQERHMIEPPKGPIVLVCCETTKGVLNIAVHPTWAPLGADRFLNMVTTGYFSSKVALFRCLRNFLCQFGLAGDPDLNKPYKSMKDDPPWLPLGPDHRSNSVGVKRFPKGYLAYAGAGPNSRSNQLIVALSDNGRLAGGSPWEVPWGEVVGDISMRTLNQFYTGYGDKGPSQGMLHREGSSEAVANDYPLLDYITECHVVEDERISDKHNV